MPSASDIRRYYVARLSQYNTVIDHFQGHIQKLEAELNASDKYLTQRYNIKYKAALQRLIAEARMEMQSLMAEREILAQRLKNGLI